MIAFLKKMYTEEEEVLIEFELLHSHVSRKLNEEDKYIGSSRFK